MREKSCKRVHQKNVRPVIPPVSIPPPPEAPKQSQPPEEVKEEVKEEAPSQLPLLRTDDQVLPVPEHVFRVEPDHGVVNLLSIQERLRDLAKRLDEYIQKTDERFDKLAILFHK